MKVGKASAPEDSRLMASSDDPENEIKYGSETNGEIGRLAQLGRFDYERERRDVARRLNIRLPV
jgi:hypothetical protein